MSKKIVSKIMKRISVKQVSCCGGHDPVRSPGAGRLRGPFKKLER